MGKITIFCFGSSKGRNLLPVLAAAALPVNATLEEETLFVEDLSGFGRMGAGMPPLALFAALIALESSSSLDDDDDEEALLPLEEEEDELLDDEEEEEEEDDEDDDESEVMDISSSFSS